MSMGIDTRGDPQKYPLGDRSFLGFRGKCIKLVRVVDYERAYSHIYGVADILVGFIVSVKIYLLGGKSCSSRGIELTARNAVDAKTFLGNELIYAREAESL